MQGATITMSTWHEQKLASKIYVVPRMLNLIPHPRHTHTHKKKRKWKNWFYYNLIIQA